MFPLALNLCCIYLKKWDLFPVLTVIQTQSSIGKSLGHEEFQAQGLMDLIDDAFLTFQLHLESLFSLWATLKSSSGFLQLYLSPWLTLMEKVCFLQLYLSPLLTLMEIVCFLQLYLSPWLTQMEKVCFNSETVVYYVEARLKLLEMGQFLLS